jgi:spore coat protein U-like protein
MWRARCLLVLVAACGLPAAAQVTTCSGSNVAFSLGTYDAFRSTPLDSSTSFVVTCTRRGGPGSDLVSVGFGPSLNSGTIATRQLKILSGVDLLTYNIYRDAGRALVWGNTVGADTVSQTINLANNTSGNLTFTIFGRINALQDVRAGSYADTLTITVTF